MLTIKIRVPYKDGGAKAILEKVRNYISDQPVIEGYQIKDDCVELYVMKANGGNGADDLILDVRHLETRIDEEAD